MEQALKHETEDQEKISRDVVRTGNAALEPEKPAEKEPERPAEPDGPAREEETGAEKLQELERSLEKPKEVKKAAPAQPEKKPAAAAETHADEAQDEYEEDREPGADKDNEEYNDPREMDLEEFAQYACKYASEIDCSITGKSLLALYERIEMMEEDGIRLTKKAAIDLIEETADKAERPSLGRKITGLFSPKYDKDGLLILHENDFFD